MEKTLHSIRKIKFNRKTRARTQVILWGGLLLILYTGYPVLKNTVLANQLDVEREEALVKLEELEEELEELEYLVSRLEDVEYITKVARHTLNLSKKDEIIINLPELDENEESEVEPLDFDIKIPHISKEATH